MRYLFLFILFFIATSIFGQSKSDVQINQTIDNWHLAAATANADIFFGTMHKNAVYIGTDASERWTKSEFEAFARPYFDKGKAWDFKAIERKIYYSNSKKIAWFDETLNTWMGVCRSSGVMIKEKKEWKILHYHLSVTIPNDKIQGFIQLVNE